MAHHAGKIVTLQEPGFVVLVDNRSGGQGLGSEWGLSLLVAAGGQKWLWDTGKSGLFLDNAKRLGLDLSHIDGLALSHGHYDHVGGLVALVDAGFSGPIAAHPALTRQRFSIKASEHKEIGMEAGLRALLPGRLQPVSNNRSLAPGLRFVTDIPRRPGRFTATANFYLDQEASKPDSVPDDAFLLMDTPRGAVVVLGCCHSGLANSLLQAAELAKAKKLHAVVGGMHLYSAGQDAQEEAAEVLETLECEIIFPGHCTGDASISFLEQRIPGRVRPLHTGLCFAFS
ncbi:metal-dependent hydrolase, beta-lactamase superfamily II [Desulfocurvibacter africanus PCS]|uniref:Metal-dependent hydrolase, beta-lactamase superfamily II n=1 Tax=Desulfocurvibacter africanus PCS TaxID=1262666 RepID=M5Q2N8_DESAF|nr:metal-dependent hydrolase, beta-lactamase superfamily II [Desulfocurvibacter africanus PCS]